MNRKIVNRRNDRITFDTLAMNIYFDDLLDEARNMKEVELIGERILDALDSALYDTAQDENINPSGEEITVDDVLLEMRGY